MVYATTLKEYGFETINEYYDYIVQSHINGLTTQVRELLSKLSRNQKALLIEKLRDGTKEEILCREYIMKTILS